jgi:hypothetical protein
MKDEAVRAEDEHFKRLTTEARLEAAEKREKALRDAFEATKEAAQALAAGFGATVEWDEEEMPAISMPNSGLERGEQA